MLSGNKHCKRSGWITQKPEALLNFCFILENAHGVVKKVRIMRFMKYSHGFTNVALSKISEILKSKFQTGFTSRAIYYNKIFT